MTTETEPITLEQYMIGEILKRLDAIEAQQATENGNWDRLWGWEDSVGRWMLLHDRGKDAGLTAWLQGLAAICTRAEQIMQAANQKTWQEAMRQARQEQEQGAL